MQAMAIHRRPLEPRNRIFYFMNLILMCAIELRGARGARAALIIRGERCQRFPIIPKLSSRADGRDPRLRLIAFLIYSIEYCIVLSIPFNGAEN